MVSTQPFFRGPTKKTRDLTAKIKAKTAKNVTNCESSVSHRDPSGNQGDLTEEAIVTEITAELAIETGTAATASGVGTATFVTGAADTVPLALAETEALGESVLVVGSAGAVELTAAQEALLLDLEIEIEIDKALAAEIVAENASLFGTLGFNVSNIVEGTLSGTELAALFRFLGW